MTFERGHMVRTLSNAQRGSETRELSTWLAGDMHKKAGAGYSVHANLPRGPVAQSGAEDGKRRIRLLPFDPSPMEKEVWKCEHVLKGCR